MFDTLSWSVANNSLIFQDYASEYYGNSLIESDILVDDGCYTFTMYDSDGNGMSESISEYEGYFTVIVNSITQTIGKQSFASFDHSIFFLHK